MTPPIAEPSTIPTRVGSNPSRRRVGDRFPRCGDARAARCARAAAPLSAAATDVPSKSLTSAATRTGKSLASNERIQSIPLRPATAASQVERASLPSGVTAPSPVTTTLRIAAA